MKHEDWMDLWGEIPKEFSNKNTFSKELKRLQNPFRVPILMELLGEYKKTKNPAFLWKAYDHCRKTDLPLPNRVMQYLDEVAENIASIKNTDNRIAFALQEALMIKGTGSGNPLKQPEDYDKKIKACCLVMVIEERRLNGENIKGDKFDLVAKKMGLSRDQVKNYYNELKEVVKNPIWGQ